LLTQTNGRAQHHIRIVHKIQHSRITS